MSDCTNELQSLQAAQDRRTQSREPASTLREVTTRLVGGSDITLLNYTSRSLLGQSSSRLLVGTRISVRLATATLNAVVAGRVVRARLTQLVEGAPRYEVALTLERDVDWGRAAGRDDLEQEGGGGTTPANVSMPVEEVTFLEDPEDVTFLQDP